MGTLTNVFLKDDDIFDFPADPNAYSTINVSSLDINVVDGEQYTFEFNNVTARWNQNGEDLYTGGEIYFSGTTFANIDLYFEVEIGSADDADNDGTPDSEDDFPSDDTEDTDTDGDGIGDNADTDDDNDGILDEVECSLTLTDGTAVSSLLPQGYSTDENAWENALAQLIPDGLAFTESFEDYNINTPLNGTSFEGFSFNITQNPVSNHEYDVDANQYGTNPRTGARQATIQDKSNSGTHTIEITFDNTVIGFGFYVGDLFDINGFTTFKISFDNELVFDITGGVGSGLTGNLTNAVDGVSAQFGNQIFTLISYFNPERPFSKVTITHSAPNNTDNFVFDDFSYIDGSSIDADSDGIVNCLDADSDNDGTPDLDDAFPLDETEDTDTDGDGTGDNADTDDDNDGQSDELEISCGSDPLDESSLPVDTDNDGTVDCFDTDDDNDGTLDEEDAFPLDETEDTDTDNDGTGDNADTDDDGDGQLDEVETTCGSDPLDENSLSVDTDNDGTPDCIDTDDDNDGTADEEDDFPLDEAEDTDTDGDGTGDNADTDDDGDGTTDDEDDFPLDETEDTDTDGDGTGDNEDSDDDGDGTADDEDDFPLDDTEDTDTDGDGTGDNEDSDDDGDGTPDDEDDFPLDDTEDTDTDGDGTGDNEDEDDDGDGTPDDEDDFPLDDTEDTDTDSDGIGNNEDEDDDGDGFSDDEEITAGTDPLNENSFPNDDDGSVLGNSGTKLAPAQAFTPNGDGNNDSWVIPGIENFPQNIVRVYNRWGHEVFAAKSYQNDWQGFYKDNREQLPAGSYLYVIDLGDGSAPLQGWVFLNY